MAVQIKRLFYRGTGSGGATDASNVSYDNASSGLSATNVQQAIDELAANEGSTGAEYPFSSGSWSGPDLSGNYTITVTAAVHQKINPTVSVFEASGSDFLEVETQVLVDSSDNVTISVPASPDLRFVGKIVII